MNWTSLLAGFCIILVRHNPAPIGHKPLHFLLRSIVFGDTFAPCVPKWAALGKGLGQALRELSNLSFVNPQHGNHWARRRLQLSIWPYIRMGGHMASHTAPPIPTAHTVPPSASCSLSLVVSLRVGSWSCDVRSNPLFHTGQSGGWVHLKTLWIWRPGHVVTSVVAIKDTSEQTESCSSCISSISILYHI